MDVRKTAVLIDDDTDDMELLGEAICVIDPDVFCIKFEFPLEAMKAMV